MTCAVGSRSSYMNGCRCSECRLANTVYKRQQRAKYRAQLAQGKLITHSATNYREFGCRCVVCTTEHANAQRRYRESVGLR